MAALHLVTCAFLAGNQISDEQRDKEQESQRKAKKPERRGDKNLRNLSEESLERSRRRRRRENFYENHRKLIEIGRKRKHLLTTVSL